MATRCEPWERRSAERQATPGRLWCLGERDENFVRGWTTDSSRSGLAFIARTGDKVNVGDRIEITYTDPRESLPDCEALRVCRVEPYGPSLHLVACTRFG